MEFIKYNKMILFMKVSSKITNRLENLRYSNVTIETISLKLLQKTKQRMINVLKSYKTSGKLMVNCKMDFWRTLGELCIYRVNNFIMKEMLKKVNFKKTLL